jgi:TM2 domain-containing membrane protein YozV
MCGALTASVKRTKRAQLSYVLPLWRWLDTMRDPVLAGVLSLIVPGVGQLYNGRILAGILWLILTPGFWLGTGGTLGWICHLVSAWCAYSYAKEHPVRV